MEIRVARPDDAEAIRAIYNQEVVSSTATFDTQEMSAEQQLTWMRAHSQPQRPALVAEQDGTVVGWAAASDWSERCAYARAAEVSVYIHRQHRGQGVGTALLSALIETCRQAGVGVLLARIVAESEASIRLHAAAGFGRVGLMRRVGEKFGRILDVEVMDLHLDAGPEDPI